MCVALGVCVPLGVKEGELEDVAVTVAPMEDHS
jgi:hypothetical protein